MNFLIDENMPRSLGAQVRALGFAVQDVRDIGLRGHDDSKVFESAVAADAIIITRDRGFAFPRSWPEGFTAGIIFVNLPDTAQADTINAMILDLLGQRIPASLLGALTTVELSRALSHTVRRRK